MSTPPNTPGEAQNIQERLLYEMRLGSFRNASRLPRESLLADELNISRTQLRDSLAELEREGFISRKQGLGTIINRHVLNVPVRMDLEIEFMDMVRRSGKQPSERLESVNSVFSVPAATKLGIGRTDEMLLVSRTVLADGRPAIFCEDYIPKAIILRECDNEELSKPIFAFLKDCCGKEAYLDITEVRPIAAPAPVAKRLSIPEGTPVLYMDEVDFDFEGTPIMYSKQFFADGFISHKVVRRKI